MARNVLVDFPVERIGDARLRNILEDLAKAIAETNDPTSLRALGQSLKMLGDHARSEAFAATKEHW